MTDEIRPVTVGTTAGVATEAVSSCIYVINNGRFIRTRRIIRLNCTHGDLGRCSRKDATWKSLTDEIYAASRIWANGRDAGI